MPPAEALAFRDGNVPIDIDLRVYRLSAIQKAAYRLARQCTAVLGEIRGDSLSVVLTFGPETREREALDVARLFFRELLDQELREKVREETAPLRALLMALAFSRTGLAPRE
jgi:His-Xaa-Ser system protein HxsD